MAIPESARMLESENTTEPEDGDVHHLYNEEASLDDHLHDHKGDVDFARTQKLLYISHFLSTWNSRAFEFGAFLFLANIFPQTLLPASVYAMSRALFAVLLSSATGYAVDRYPRLPVIRWSIGKSLL